jgi:leukotriene-A4 hydrolase
MTKRLLAASLILTAMLQPTVQAAPDDPTTLAAVAANSYANVREVRVEHLDLDLNVDFKQRRLSGAVTLDLKRVDPNARQVVLDTKGLKIAKVETSVDGKSWQPAQFKLGADHVRIHYSTQPDASGLQWLNPSQTAGKQQPFLFSQSESIAGRSWIPCQDTPYVRATYDARITTPKGLRAVMSAEMSDQLGDDGAWHFHMPQPIPDYLIALAVGDLAFKSTGERTGVYAEPSVVDKAAYEFGETGKTVDLMEQNFGPYRWGRYDILVLPPSFPFGGMENPRLTFATPTVLTGDRQLVSLISHELAHSWSGNLVTNASWSDFWLNEGFTQYLTYRLVELQFGKERADMERVLGLESLEDSFAHSDPIDHPLYRSTPAKDPDAIYSTVPYERGALFLTWVESKFGRPAFDQFLRGWFDDHAFQSASTSEFLDYLKVKLLSQKPDLITQKQIDDWVYQKPLPGDTLLPHSALLDKVQKARADWLAGKLVTDALPGDWNVHEWVYFLDGMPDSVTLDQLKSLDARFKLTGSNNAIVAGSWYRLAIVHGDTAVYPEVQDYLCHIGRMYLVKPLYRELSKTKDGRKFAEKVYAQAKPLYHPMTQAAVERVLKEKS